MPDKQPKMTTARANRILEKAGFAERLWYDRSCSTYFFVEGETTNWQQSGLYAVRLSELDEKDIIEYRNQLAGARV